MQIESSRGPITLRPVASADAEALRQLRLEALQSHPTVYGADYETQVQQPAEYWQQRVDRTIGSAEEAMFVAEAGGQLLGMTGIFRDRGLKVRHTATVISVYVRAEWRGNRVTDGLIELCLAWARAHGVIRARVAVITSNASAIRCYVRCGFTVYGVEPAVILHNGVYHDELLLGRLAAVDHPKHRRSDGDLDD